METNFFESLAKIVESGDTAKMLTRKDLLEKVDSILPIIFQKLRTKERFRLVKNHNSADKRLLLILQQQFSFSQATIQLLKLKSEEKEVYIVLVPKLRNSQIGRRYQNRRGRIEFVLFTKEELVGYSKLFTDIQKQIKTESLEFQRTLQQLLNYFWPAQKTNFGKLWRMIQEFLILRKKGKSKKQTLIYEKALKKIFSYPDQLQGVQEFLLKYFQAKFNIKISDIDLRQRGITEKRKKIKPSTLRLMKNSPLNEYFREIEFDDELTQKQLQQFEKAINQIFPKLPKTRSIPTLKIRKLGRFHAQGMYFPKENIIAIDFRKRSARSNLSPFLSFIHEYGHYLDHQWQAGLVLSEQEDFQKIRRKLIGNLDVLTIKSYVSRKLNYYLSSTEIFARLFEIYIFSKGIHSDILDNSSSFKLPEYQMLKPAIEEIRNYYDELLK